MLPVLLIHLVYKSLWLLGVALPLWSAGTPFDPTMTMFAWAMAIGVALDLVIIPWGYVWANYVRRPAERGEQSERAPEGVGGAVERPQRSLRGDHADGDPVGALDEDEHEIGAHHVEAQQRHFGHWTLPRLHPSRAHD